MMTTGNDGEGTNSAPQTSPEGAGIAQPAGAGATDTGLKRDQNEDAFLVDDDLGLYIVCDGMGGHARGEVASSTAVQAAHELFRAHRPAVEQFMAGQGSAEPITALATQAIQAACQAVYTSATSQPGHAGMGSTMTLLVVGGREAVLGHVGDTRLYLIRNCAAYPLTLDHTMAEELVRNGTLTTEQAKGSRWAHVLTRCIGTQASVQVDTLVFDVMPGDRLLLCSDGLSEYLTEPGELARMVNEELENAPDTLVAWANERGGHDNITAVVVQISPDEPLSSASLLLDAQHHVELSTLQSIPLLADLTMPQLLRILQVGRIVSLPKDTSLFGEGDPFDAATVVLAGRLRVLRNNLPVALSNPGDCLGSGLALRPRATHAGLVADIDSKVLLISSDALLALQNRRPRLANILLTRLGLCLSDAVGAHHANLALSRLEETPVRESPIADIV